jgi:hypothetical protein
MATPTNLSKIQNAQVRTGEEMYDFVYEVGDAIYEESGTVDATTESILRGIATNVKTLSDPKAIAPYFGEVRDIASSEGAPQTASAVIAAAKWFWCNVEDPAACSAASSARTSIVAAATVPAYARQTMLTTKQKQMLLYVGVPVLLTSIGVYFILRK